MLRTVAIGETSSFRYIGVKPSIDKSISRQIVGELIVPNWFCFWNSFHNEHVDGQVHTEFSFDVGDAIDAFGRETVDKTTVEIAHQIAGVLRIQGDNPLVLPEVVTIDHATPMFGEEANEMREFIRHLNSSEA